MEIFKKWGGFFPIQNLLVEYGFLSRMRLKAIRTYIALSFFANRDTGNCWPSVEKLRNITGLSKDAQWKAVKELEKLGLVKTWRHRKERGRMFKKFYHIELITDIRPSITEEYQYPPKTDKRPLQRDGKGRFSRLISVKNGSAKSVGDGRSLSAGHGQRTKVLNNRSSTRLNQGKPGLRPLTLSFKEIIDMFSGDVKKAEEYLDSHGYDIKAFQERGPQ